MKSIYSIMLFYFSILFLDAILAESDLSRFTAFYLVVQRQRREGEIETLSCDGLLSIRREATIAVIKTVVSSESRCYSRRKAPACTL